MSHNADIVAEFLVESHENLERIERELVALESSPGDSATLASVFRSVHTIKGTCGFLGFGRLEKVAHAGENLLSLLRDEELEFGPPMAEGLLAMVDAMKGMLATIEASGSEGSDGHAGLLARLGALSRGGVAPASAPHAAAPAPAPAIADTSVRVDVVLLDKLMNLVGELVLTRNQVLQLTATQASSPLGAAVQRLNLITADLQEGVMKTRMLPVEQVFAKLPRLVRDLAASCGKDVRTEMDGGATELDRTLIEAIKDPLTHLVRNAIDHGVEDPATRRARGKPVPATISLRAYHAAGQVNLEIADDGNGIDCDKIRQKAVAQGMVSADAARGMGELELLPLIFRPGFSTAARVTAVSGRGVGMDVVRTNIERIGGTVDVDTAAGRGTTIRIKIPLTLAIIPALIVASGGGRYAIPQASLLELVRAPADRLESFHGAAVYRLRGRLLPIVDLRAVFREPAREAQDTLNIIVLHTQEHAFGLLVDEIQDTADIVVKPLSAHVRAIGAFSGATVLGDGGVALILDVAGVAEASGAVGDIVERAPAPTPAPAAVVDDSLLLCRGAGGGVVAIPLAGVNRLAQIPVSAIERTGDEEVVQYHGSILPLRRLSALLGERDGCDPEDKLDIVLAGDVGLVVGEILDIVQCPAKVERRSPRPGVVGSLVVKGRVTELLDIGELLRTAGPRPAAEAVAA